MTHGITKSFSEFDASPLLYCVPARMSLKFAWHRSLHLTSLDRDDNQETLLKRTNKNE